MHKLHMGLLRSSLNRLAPASLTAALLLSGVALLAAAFVPPKANAANLILNGGFEGGVQSVTMNGFTNNNVPIDWVPNAAFVQFSASNGVVSNPVHSGIAALSIGSPANQPPIAELSQTFADVAGATYTVTLFYEGVPPAFVPGDPNANFLFVVFGYGINQIGIPTNGFQTATVVLIGTGMDTVDITASTNAGVWIVDDISITGPGVPEPATWAMMLIGFAGLGFAFRHSRRKVSFA
jgi:hypothetical protein